MEQINCVSANIPPQSKLKLDFETLPRDTAARHPARHSRETLPRFFLRQRANIVRFAHMFATKPCVELYIRVFFVHA